jgi:DtxR family Mn-dependent transcriptional regulator
MPSSTVEDYIKQIYALQQQIVRTDRIAPGQIASAVGVVPGTATTMLKSLAQSGLVDYESRQGVRLTTAGEKLALGVLRRHRLIELFLVKVLDFDWADVHDDAERLEHALSDKLVDRIDAFLGRPDYDPHGDPIPSASGKLKPRALVALVDAKIGQPMQIARVGDQDKDFLAYANQRGLVPGARVIVSEADRFGGVLSAIVDDRAPITLGISAAGKLFVTPAD